MNAGNATRNLTFELKISVNEERQDSKNTGHLLPENNDSKAGLRHQIRKAITIDSLASGAMLGSDCDSSRGKQKSSRERRSGRKQARVTSTGIKELIALRTSPKT
jgi:hypothetical protein